MGIEQDRRQDPPRQRTEQSRQNARYGMLLFMAYLAFYAVFVLLNTFRPELMDAVPAAGVNLAIWYGFALIAVALALALIYVWLCRGGRVGSAHQDGGQSPPYTKAEGRP